MNILDFDVSGVPLCIFKLSVLVVIVEKFSVDFILI